MMSSFAIITLLEIPLYHRIEGLSLGIPFVHLRPPYILLYHGIGRTVHGNALSDLRPPYPTVTVRKKSGCYIISTQGNGIEF